MLDTSRSLDLVKTSKLVLSAAIAGATIWFCHAAYSSLSRSPPSQSITSTTNQGTHLEDHETTVPSYQAPFHTGDRRSHRNIRGPRDPLNYIPVRSAKLSPRRNKPGYILQVVQCRFSMTFDRIVRGNNEIIRIFDLWSTTSVAPFPIEVVMDNPPTRDESSIEWSTGNLDVLTRQLDSSWIALAGGRLCRKLTISLPEEKIRITDGIGILPTTDRVLLPHDLTTLEWTGNREQLPLFFTQQPAFTTQALANLTLHCALSIDECKRLLGWGNTHLVNVNIKTIRAVNDPDLGQPRALLPPPPNSPQDIPMTALRSLNITSTADIRDLYASSPRFQFPALRKVTLRVSSTNFDILECNRYLTNSGANPKWKVRCAMNRRQESEMMHIYGRRFVRLPSQAEFSGSGGIHNQLDASDYLGDPLL
ncbi:hypothetical protein J132_08979 [Termitomyces sp. J132]|nr:hypothetical protein H2248_004423 [Termitomyces sp. 'cryptogamus']KNZ76700.1 hypothetical protein J132_08979 [Termitomyces sp. J132]